MNLAPVPKSTTEKILVQSLRGAVTKQIPFWLMRQAGRYLPEYRELRQKAGSFLDLCFNPSFACEVTLQPLRRFDMDAAILFSDILVVPYALGQNLSFVEGEGPRLDPVLDLQGLGKLEDHGRKIDAVYEALSLVKKELSSDKALIGFAGAPWTVACYMVDGRGGTGFPKTREVSKNDKVFFQKLIDKVTEATITHLCAQAKNGADVLQIFDSWSGLAGDDGFKQWVIEPTARIVAAVRKAYPHVPIIGFPRGAGNKIAAYVHETGVDGVGVDQQTSLAAVKETVSAQTCLQGNLDPHILVTGGQMLVDGVQEILDTCRGRPFIFNLGHGVEKETPPENVALLAKTVREFVC